MAQLFNPQRLVMLIIIVCALASLGQPARAATLYCSSTNLPDRWGFQRNHDSGRLFEHDLTADCTNKRTGENYRLKMYGGGLALRFSFGSAYALVCPFQSIVAGTYYGVSAEAAVLLGGGAAVFASASGACFFAKGTLIGAGGSLVGAQIELTRDR